MLHSLRVLADGHAPKRVMFEAHSLQEAIDQAEHQGYTVLQAHAGEGLDFLHFFSKPSAFKSNAFPLVLFCQEFHSLFDAGLTVTDVLQTLIEKETQAFAKEIMQQLLGAIKEGKTLSQAMGLNPQAFPQLFVATISAAETTGDLSEALVRFASYLESVETLKKKILSASLYPAIVTSFAFCVLAFLVVFIIPKFSNIYQTQVNNISASTQFLLDVGQFSQNYGAILGLIVVVLMVTLVMTFIREESRQTLLAWCWRVPIIGEHIRVYTLTRFYRTMAMLLKSGIPVLQSLSMLDNLLGSQLKQQLAETKKMVSEGQSFSIAMQKNGLLTPVATRLFQVGEQTGTLDLMMARAASFHEENMVRWIDRFIKILEPSLMALIGILIGGIVLLMYMPIFELASAIE